MGDGGLTDEGLLTSAGVDTSTDVMGWVLAVALSVPGSQRPSFDDLRKAARQQRSGRLDRIHIGVAEPGGMFSFIPPSGGR